MDLATARAEVKARGFARISNARIDAWLNEARNEFEDAYPFPWLEQTGSTPAPMLILNLKYIQYVVDDAGCELTGVPAQQIVAMGGTIDTAGRPEVWWLDGEGQTDGQVLLKTYPVNASVVLTVRYIAESPELEDDTDEPMIPARYHQTWIDLAVARAHMHATNEAQAAAIRQIASADLGTIITRYATRNRQNPEYQTLREW